MNHKPNSAGSPFVGLDPSSDGVPELRVQVQGYAFVQQYSRIVSAIRRELFGGEAGKVNHSDTPIADAIRDGSLNYADPPNGRYCAPGPTMNVNTIRVLEDWSRKMESGCETNP